MSQLQKVAPFVRRPVPIGDPPAQEPVQTWCNTCRGMRFVNGGFVNNKTVVLPCPACSGSTRTGIASKEQAELVQVVFGGAQIPPEMHEWTFATYPLDGDRAAHANVLQFASEQLASPGGQRGLFLTGKLGTGKTGLAVSLLHRVIDAQKTCLFFNEAELFRRLYASMSGHGSESKDDILSIAISVPWLVLDDVGVMRPKSPEYIVETYYSILEERWNHGRHTVITSNYSTAGLRHHWIGKATDGQFYQCDRVIERLRAFYVGVVMQGKNLRKER